MRKALGRAAWSVLGHVAVMVGAGAFPRDAQAQQSRNVDLPRFEPSAPGDRFFGVPSPDTPGRMVLRGGVVLDYARNPLIISDSDGNTVGRVVAHQMLLHLTAGLALADRVGLTLDLPLGLVNRGDGTFEAGTFTGASAFASPGGAGVGDLRLGARLMLVGASDRPFELALGGYLWLPTGSRNDFLTDARLRGQVHVIAGGQLDRFVWSAMIGPTLRSAQSYGGVRTGSQLSWGAGAGILLGAARGVQVGVETQGGVTLVDSTRSSNSEALLGVKARVVPALEVGLGMGRGIALGLGTPDYRGLFSAIYTLVIARPHASASRESRPMPADRDGDLVADELDACPDVSGRTSDDPKRNGCPLPLDADGDQIADDVDACPRQAGRPSDDAKTNGCPLPLDADGDQISDGDDACPHLAGVKSADPGTNGCPADSDGDGFRDDQDACPHEKGVDDADPAKRGCPKLVRVTRDEILILEQVEFDTNQATIKSASDALLASVAQVLREHPEILAVEVQGHTDDRGKKARNAILSQGRASAVVGMLVGQGVEAGRLSAKGYGQDAPIASNEDEEGRRKNRRVQFLVTSRKNADGNPPARTEP